MAQEPSLPTANRDRQRHLKLAPGGLHRIVPIRSALKTRKENYERYLALAQAQARSGDTIGAENYYQHAEHYFRSMSADRETT